MIKSSNVLSDVIRMDLSCKRVNCPFLKGIILEVMVLVHGKVSAS